MGYFPGVLAHVGERVSGIRELGKRRAGSLQRLPDSRQQAGIYQYRSLHIDWSAPAIRLLALNETVRIVLVVVRGK
jgi:hypothetical protein